MSELDMNNGNRGAQFGTYMNYPTKYPGYLGIWINRYANPDITWETSRKFNVGMDMTLFKNLNIVVDYFRDKVSNILMRRDYLPTTMGLTANISANVGKAKGWGTDVSVDYTKSFKNTLWIKGQGNFTYAHHEFLYYEEPDYPANLSYLSHKGQTLNQMNGFIAERLFIDESDVKNSPRQNFGEYGAGDIKYRDINGDGEITGLDVVPIGFPISKAPEIIYGGGLSAGYKGFDLSFFLQGTARTSFWIDPYLTAPFIANMSSDPNIFLGSGSRNGLLKAYADNYWSEDNRNSYALWPRLSHTPNENNNQLSTWFMRSGAFLRLKSVELGYTIPKKVFGSKFIPVIRVYANGLNLLTFSQFNIWDVEMGGYGLGYPIQKVVNAGLTVNF